MKKSLKKQLEALNMKQVQIADAIGCNRSYFSKIWNGHTPLSERFSARLGKLIADPSYNFGKKRRVPVAPKAVLKKAVNNIALFEPPVQEPMPQVYEKFGPKDFTVSMQEIGAAREETLPPQEPTDGMYIDSLLSDLALAQKAIGALYLENIKLQNGSGKN